jgi:hypothetical protein
VSLALRALLDDRLAVGSGYTSGEVSMKPIDWDKPLITTCAQKKPVRLICNDRVPDELGLDHILLVKTAAGKEFVMCVKADGTNVFGHLAVTNVTHKVKTFVYLCKHKGPNNGYYIVTEDCTPLDEAQTKHYIVDQTVVEFEV